jgi:hypothetical protein
MNFARIGLLFLPLTLSFSQSLFTKAPPAIDNALRARVQAFYQAFIDKKFRFAYEMVAEDSKETFLAGGKPNLESCDFTKIEYFEDFSKADVLMGCKGTFSFHGQMMNVTFPLSSKWVLTDGQWWWSAVPPKGRDTPWGFWGEKEGEPSPKNDGNPGPAPVAARPSVPVDPRAVANQILHSIKVDKTDVVLRGYESSKDEVHLTNGMPGPITFTVDKPSAAGLSIKPLSGELNSGEQAAIVFEFNTDDPSITCGECAKRVKPSLTVNIRISPTGQVFTVNLTFSLPPELQKQLPPEIQKQQPKP